MSEADRIAASAAPVTYSSLVADFRALGVRSGDVLLVHCALGRVGWVCGGPQAVIEALRDVLGETGTLVMPAHAADWSEPGNWGDPPVPEAWWPTIRAEMPAYDRALTPTRDMGRVAETFRRVDDARRSGHPQVSMAAAGRHAQMIVAEHDLAAGFGECSPLKPLYDLNARILLIGVGYARCTALHLAEHRAPGYRPASMPSGAAIRVDGRREWVEYTGTAYDPDDFDTIGAVYAAAGREAACGYVGQAPSRVLAMPDLVDFAADWMGRHRRNL